jgi:hypothetical protein
MNFKALKPRYKFAIINGLIAAIFFILAFVILNVISNPILYIITKVGIYAVTGGILSLLPLVWLEKYLKIVNIIIIQYFFSFVFGYIVGLLYEIGSKKNKLLGIILVIIIYLLSAISPILLFIISIALSGGTYT